MFNMRDKLSNRYLKYKNQKLLAFLFMLIVFIGALSIAVLLILSETLFYEIDEFTNCPQWYQTTIYASLAIIFFGLIGCGFTKNRLNTSNSEIIVNVSLFILGFVIMIFFTLLRVEAYWKSVVISIGGAMGSIGFFCGTASVIGQLKKLKNESEYAFLLRSFEKKQKTFYLKIAPGSLTEIKEVAHYFNTSLPNELVDFLLEFDGVGEFLFSAKRIVEITKLVRKNFKDTTFKVDDLCFIGEGGQGNYFCYKIKDDGSIDDSNIFLWNHETNERIYVAESLPELIRKFYGGLLNNILN